MKKYYYSLIAATAMLFATTSCSQDEELVPQGGNDVTTFKVELQGTNAGSRAAGDGKTVDKLYYEVHQNGKIVKDLTADIKDGQATVEIPLLRGEVYDIIFWAQKSTGSIYNAADLTAISVDYNKSAANAEAYDAFFNALDDFKATGEATTVELRRPFAQLNVATTETDWTQAKDMIEGTDAPVTTSQVEVHGLATQFNALTGEASVIQDDVTFTQAAITAETMTIEEVKYINLGMNYLLVPGTKAPQGTGSHTAATENEVKTTTDVDVTFWRGSNELFTLEVPAAPIHRNYRTNILGNLLASDKTFEVVVMPDFDDDYNIYQYTAATAKEFTDILTSLNAETYNGPTDVTITLEGDIEWATGAEHGSTPFLTSASKVETLTIAGNGHTITATGSGVGSIRAANAAKLIFNDVTIEDKSTSYAESNWEFTYLEFAGKLEFNNVTFNSGITVQAENNETDLNATFTDCTFISNADNEYSVWVSDGTSVFSNCKFQGTRGLKMHEAYSSEIASVTVDNCTFDNLTKKPGVAIGTLNANTAVIIKNSAFVNCQSGDQSLYIYESDTDVATFNFKNENNTVFNETANELEIGSAAALKAFTNMVNNGTTYSGKTIKLTADIDLGNEPWTPIGECTSGKYFQGTFDGQNHTISNLYVDNSTDESEYSTSGLFGWIDADGATIKNVKVDHATIKGSHWTGVIAGYMTGTIEGCTVTNATVIGYNVNDEANGDKIGGIVGYLNEQSYLNNNTVSSSTIKGNRDIGGIAGSVAFSTYEMLNNKVENTTISYITSKDYASAGAIVSGRTNYTVHESNVANNVDVICLIENANELKSAITSVLTSAKEEVITLAAGTYTQDINLTVAELNNATEGKLTFKAAEGKEVVMAGTITLGYRNQGTGSAAFNKDIVFENIVFDHADTEKHSLDVQDVKSLTLKNCKIVGDGEYGIGSARGNSTGASSITECTFVNAGMQVLGNFGTGLVIDQCTFTESRINVQAGNGVTVQNCNFNNTLTSANLNDSFYLVRSNSTPITVKNCGISIDSNLEEVASNKEEWGILWNRGTTDWTVENVAVTMTDAAKTQTALSVTKATSTGAINSTNLTLNGERVE